MRCEQHKDNKSEKQTEKKISNIFKMHGIVNSNQGIEKAMSQQEYVAFFRNTDKDKNFIFFFFHEEKEDIAGVVQVSE